jgi:hypothetical protein
VTVRTTDSSATSPADFVAQWLRVTIPPGRRRTVLTIPLVPDRTDEPDEQFDVVLIDPVGADIGGDHEHVTIVDDD